MISKQPTSKQGETARSKATKATFRRKLAAESRAGTRLSAFDAARYLDTDEAVAEFIDVALETGDPAVLVRAIGEVARAQGMGLVAKRAGLGRESLYKALQPSSHPRLETILRVARAIGIRLHASAA